MKPGLRNLFMKKLTCDRVVPTSPANISWLISRITATGLPSCRSWPAAKVCVPAASHWNFVHRILQFADYRRSRKKNRDEPKHGRCDAFGRIARTLDHRLNCLGSFMSHEALDLRDQAAFRSLSAECKTGDGE